MDFDSTTVLAENETGLARYGSLENLLREKPGAKKPPVVPIAVRFTFSCGVAVVLSKEDGGEPHFTFLSPCCGAGLATLLRKDYSVKNLANLRPETYSVCQKCSLAFPPTYPSRIGGEISPYVFETILTRGADAMAATIMAAAMAALVNNWGALTTDELTDLHRRWGSKPRVLGSLLRQLP